MFIELAEFLRCPGDHEEEFCVVTPDRMEGRHISEGTIGCPRCRREFPIVDGVAVLTETGQRAPLAPVPGSTIDPTDVAALLHIAGPGGYLVMVGSAALLSEDLGTVIEGVHVVAINAPGDLPSGGGVSRLDGSGHLPVRSNMARGVVLGAECDETMVRDAGRVVLRGLRVVSLSERELPEGLRCLARGHGMTVGEKS